MIKMVINALRAYTLDVYPVLRLTYAPRLQLSRSFTNKTKITIFFKRRSTNKQKNKVTANRIRTLKHG